MENVFLQEIDHHAKRVAVGRRIEVQRAARVVDVEPALGNLGAVDGARDVPGLVPQRHVVVVQRVELVALAVGQLDHVARQVDGARAANFDVYEGQALVAEASNERIAGSIVIQRAMRLQAPLPVPQTHDPPLVIRFAIQK